MSFTAEFHMPGAYHFEGPNGSGQVLSAGIFRPPVSPAASSYNLAKSTGSLYSDVSMSTTPAAKAKRKRTRTRESTPMDWNMNMDGAGDAREEDERTTNADGRQIRYTLAGQIDTPGSASNTANGELDESIYSDIDYRRHLGPDRAVEEFDPPSAFSSTIHLNSGAQASPSATGWSAFAVNTIGGVVGKVWEFCKGGAFRGFHAGGGKGYELNGSVSREEGGPRSPTVQTGDGSPDSSAVPGGFPRFEFQDLNAPETTPQPAAKRRQLGENDELRRNWVMVDEPQNKASRRYTSDAPSKTPSGRSTRNSRKSGFAAPTTSSGRRINVPVSRLGNGTPHLQRRASLRISHAGSPNLSAREPASFAQPRSPSSFAAPSSRLPITAQPSRATPNPFAVAGVSTNSRPSSRQSMIPSPVPSPVAQSHGHRRNYSTASAATTGASRGRAGGPKIDADDIEASPRLDAEARQLAQRKLAADRDAETRVDDFNARLLRMIRQGKEALGTTVEVLDDGEAGGWEFEDED